MGGAKCIVAARRMQAEVPALCTRALHFNRNHGGDTRANSPAITLIKTLHEAGTIKIEQEEDSHAFLKVVSNTVDDIVKLYTNLDIRDRDPSPGVPIDRETARHTMSAAAATTTSATLAHAPAPAPARTRIRR